MPLPGGAFGMRIYPFIKFRSRLGQSILQILRLVQLNLFERRDLDELFCPEKQKIPLHNNQLSLFQI